MSARPTFSQIHGSLPEVQELDWHQLSDRERDLLRAIGYRDVLPIDGLQQHNTDLTAPEWVPTDVRGGTAPLPVYPQPIDLPPRKPSR